MMIPVLLNILLDFGLLHSMAMAETLPNTPSQTSTTEAGSSEDGLKKKTPQYRTSRLTREASERNAIHRTLNLTLGVDKVIDMDFRPNKDAPFIVGNPKIVTQTLVNLGDQIQLVLKPLAAGVTTYTIRDQFGVIQLIYTIRVSEPSKPEVGRGTSELRKLLGELKELFRDIEGLEFRLVGQRIIMEGEILVPADYARLFRVLNEEGLYARTVLNLTTLSPVSLQLITKKMQEDINIFAPNVRTRIVNGVIFLEGSVDSVDQSNRAVKIASLYLPEARPKNPLLLTEKDRVEFLTRASIQNFIIINGAPPRKQQKLVRLTLHFVELAKDYNRLFQFNWAPGLRTTANIGFGASPQGGIGTSGTSFSGTISSLFPKLQSLQDAGYARILRVGTIVVRSGQPAKLEEHKDIPITVTTPNGQNVVSTIDVGLNAAVTPLILGQSEDIELDLKLAQTVLVGKGPAVNNHRIETKLYVKSNESAAVAGVSSSDVETSFNKKEDDGSSQTDAPLFDLTRKKSFSKRKSQFIIFVTPQIIENASDGTEDMKKNFRVKVK